MRMIKRKPLTVMLTVMALTLTPPVAFANSTGCIIASATAIDDPAVSIYVGENLTVTQAADSHDDIESEGTTVVNGDVIANLTHPMLLAGKAMWGLGFQPPKNADMLLVGGNIQADKTTPVFSSGNTRIGGTGANTYIATKQNQETHMGRYHAAWEYGNQSNPRVLTNLGKTSALKGDMTGNNDTVDYNNYVNRILKPLSSELTAMPTTGQITFSKAADVKNFTVMANSTADIRNEGWITFTGDSQNHPQKFELDVNTVEAAKTRLNVLQWSLDFRNVSDSQPIIINVTGRTSYTWNTGWRIMVNGVDSTTHVNADANNGLESLQRFKQIASRIIWNYPNMTSLTLDSAHIYGDTDGKDKFRWGRAVLFPGSILLPNGSMHDIADTNGRLLIGKNLTLDIWEHHNAPWIGMPDTPQCFTVNGKTTATIS